jgi:hypothetical protein
MKTLQGSRIFLCHYLMVIFLFKVSHPWAIPLTLCLSDLAGAADSWGVRQSFLPPREEGPGPWRWVTDPRWLCRRVGWSTRKQVPEVLAMEGLEGAKKPARRAQWPPTVSAGASASSVLATCFCALHWLGYWMGVWGSQCKCELIRWPGCQKPGHQTVSSFSLSNILASKKVLYQNSVCGSL